MRKARGKLAFVPLALAAAFSFVPLAHADTFNFTFTDLGGVSGSGTLTGANEGAGNPWLLTGCTACTFSDGDDSGSVSLVANPNGPGGSSDVDGIVYDDLLDLYQNSGAYLDSNGLLFQFGDSDYLNIFFGYSVGGGGPDFYGWYDSPQGNGDDGFLSETGTFTITSYDIGAPVVAEPGTLLLMGTGIFGLAAFMMWRPTRLGLAVNR